MPSHANKMFCEIFVEAFSGDITLLAVADLEI